MMSTVVHDLSTRLRLAETAANKQLLVKTPGLTILYLSIAPGQGMPLHNHPGCTVAIQGMIGQATVLLDDESHDLGPQELLSFSGNKMVSPRNESSSAAAVLITLSVEPA